MRFLLSVSDMIYDQPVNQVFDVIQKYDINNMVGGMELNIQDIDDSKYDKISNIIYKLKEKDMVIQIHAPELSQNLDNIYKLLDIYNKFASIYQDEIKITFHPFEYKEEVEDAIYRSNVVLKQIVKYIKENKYNLKVCIENLDNVRNNKRLKIENIQKIIQSVNNTYITYDIGHELIEDSCSYSVPLKLESKIQNVHLYDVRGFKTHFPFIDGKVDLDRTFSYLRWIDYKENVVLEIALEYFNENTFEDKLKSYIGEFDKLNKYIKKYNLK